MLAVGTLEPRKNLARAAEAARLAGVELRVVGAPGWGGVSVDGWRGWVEDDELARLYRGARCLVYPSLYEGFGIPVLEAMACGTPVVTSRGGATEEVAGGAAVLVDPRDPAAIAAGISEAERRRDELRARVSSVRAAFTWEQRQTRRGALEGARVTPLVVVDADVLGRRATGDETYVANLLRELAALPPTPGCASRPLRAIPSSFPRESSAPARRPRAGAAHGVVAPAPAAARSSGARPHAVRAASRGPCPAVVTVHDLSFERRRADAAAGPASSFARVVPRAVRRARRVLTVSSGRGATSIGMYGLDPERGGRDAERRRPRLPAARSSGEAHRGTYALAVGASRRARTSSPRSARRGPWASSSSSSGPTKDAELAAELRRGGARLEGYVTRSRGGHSTAAPRASCSRPASRASASRWSRRWRAGRRW